MKLWTEDMMNWARIQMKKWMDKKNEQRARVQRRWDNRGIMKDAFQKWISLIHRVDTDRGQIRKEEKVKKEKTYGIKHWGRVRTIPKLYERVKSFLQTGVGDYIAIHDKNPGNGCLRST
eukprot:3477306-Pleurochrysis_carterae.AAC.1